MFSGQSSCLKNNHLNPARAVSSAVATTVVVGLIAVAIVAGALYTFSIPGTPSNSTSVSTSSTRTTSNATSSSCIQTTRSTGSNHSQGGSVVFSVEKPIWAGNVPYALTYDPQNQMLYIANNPNGGMINDSNSVTVVDIVTYNVVNTIFGFAASPWDIAYSPFTNNVYVTDYASDMVSVVNTTTNMIAENITVAGHPTGIIYDSSSHMMYAAIASSGTVVGINSSNQIFSNITVGGYPVGLVYDSQNNNIYVANNANDSLDVISGSTLQQIARIPGEGNYQGGSPSAGLPYAIAYDPNNNLVYFTNNDSNRISVIDTSTNSIIQNVTVGQFPSGITYDPSTKEILVTNWGSGSVSVIDDSTNGVVANITKVGLHPFGIAYDSYDDHVFVTDQSSINVYPVVINATSLTYSSTTASSSTAVITSTCSSSPYS